VSVSASAPPPSLSSSSSSSSSSAATSSVGMEGSAQPMASSAGPSVLTSEQAGWLDLMMSYVSYYVRLSSASIAMPRSSCRVVVVVQSSSEQSSGLQSMVRWVSAAASPGPESSAVCGELCM
jgi:hypothetical protein